MEELTAIELAAVRSLERLAQKWPSSLWLFSASGSLHVMKCLPDGEKAHLQSDGVDPEYVVTTIKGISNDGGDW